MDEVLDVATLATDFGFGSLVRWLLGLLGLVLVVGGVGLWLAADVGVVLPALLVVVGLLLMVAPVALLLVAELL
ncbi:hypothetical protein [Halosimplex salinum]|uniref:hypothetical protein n=1 Tax=Halosimplex salinum TaxID=1710538 RepID=UPI000F48B335|nr:hypothetical protein [Halosimplex salinum]